MGLASRAWIPIPIDLPSDEMHVPFIIVGAGTKAIVETAAARLVALAPVALGRSTGGRTAQLGFHDRRHVVRNYCSCSDRNGKATRSHRNGSSKNGCKEVGGKQTGVQETGAKKTGVKRWE